MYDDMDEDDLWLDAMIANIELKPRFSFWKFMLVFLMSSYLSSYLFK
jgi:hypothetical protein